MSNEIIMKKRRPYQKARPMKSKSDKDLMLAIVRNKDRSAFEALYKKFASDSYNLAAYIIGPRLQADDVVQEAFHAIWNSGASFSPRENSSVKSWVLRIVANKALLALRARRKIKEIDDEDLSHSPATRMETDTRSTQDELVEALRMNLKRLPDKNRQCIALYFGANLSQREIATTLGLPPRTVSFNIQKTLKELRRRLTESGFATISALDANAQIQHAICAGQPLPDSLTQCPSMLPSLKSHPNKVVQSPRKLSISLVLSIAALLCVVTSYYFLRSPENPTLEKQRNTPALASIEESNKVESIQTERIKFHKVWTFENPASDKDFKILRGDWIHRPINNGKGAMEMKTNELIVSVLSSLRLPLKLTIRAQPLAYGQIKAGGLFSEDRTPEFGVFRNANPKSLKMIESDFVRYISDRFLDGWVNQKRVSVIYLHQHSYDPFALTFRGRTIISRIEIEEIEVDALPDLSAYKAAIARIPPNERVHSVIIPEMKSCHPTEPVKIEFYPVSPKAKGSLK